MAALVAPLVATIMLAALVLLAGCGGGGADRTKAHVRLVNASGGYARLDVQQGGAVRQSALTYGQSADYADFDRGRSDVTLRATGSASALATLQPTLDKDRHYTLLAYGSAGALAQVLLDDDEGAAASGQTLLRVINGAPDAGTLDVYVTAADDSLAAAVPVASAAAYGALGGYVPIASGNWRLRVAGAGSRSDLRLDAPDLALGSRQRMTLVVTPGAGGVLVNALALVQQGGIARLDGTQARVRAVAGVAGAAVVSAGLGGVPLLAGIGTPAVGGYQRVGAGAVSPVVSVAGVAAPAPATTLAAGADYTLLVHGDAAAPRVAWITDDNRLPSVGGQARMRLVNGLADAGTALAMTVDYLPIAGGVAAGTASDYGLVDADTSAQIAVNALGAAQPLMSAADQALAAGSVYSVFVVGAAAAPTGILRRDR
ncbi:MAG TPA: DUF4397 domain-containing protein [Rubrivivax sp.]|nr:DUF4397 domain-containing protein [Rubrivivax sp.]